MIQILSYCVWEQMDYGVIDALVQETNEGWNLSPEGLAECVRRVASICGVVVAIQKWGWVLIPVSIQVRAMTPHFEGES